MEEKINNKKSKIIIPIIILILMVIFAFTYSIIKYEKKIEDENKAKDIKKDIISYLKGKYEGEFVNIELIDNTSSNIISTNERCLWYYTQSR